MTLTRRIPSVAFMLLAATSYSTAQESASPGVKPRAIRDVPLNSATRAALTDALQNQDYQRAEKLLVKAIEQYPKDPSLLRLAGSIFFLDGQDLNSVIAIKKAEKLAPLDDASRFTLAMSYIRLNHGDWARQELAKLVNSDPRNAVYPYWQARLDYDDQLFGAAVEKLNRAIELDPEYAKAYDNLGLCLEAQGKLEQAVQAYEKANELNSRRKPGSPWPPLNFGILLTRLAVTPRQNDFCGNQRATTGASRSPITAWV